MTSDHICLASESVAFDLDWHPLLDPDPSQKEEKDLQPIKNETEVKPELKVKVEMVESTVGNSQSDVKLEPNALSKSDEKQNKNQVWPRRVPPSIPLVSVSNL